MSVRITGKNRTNPNKALPVASIIEWEKLIVYIMLSSSSWRSGRTDLTPDHRWEPIAILFVGGLFQVWNPVFHMYSDQIDLWKIH